MNWNTRESTDRGPATRYKFSKAPCEGFELLRISAS